MPREAQPHERWFSAYVSADGRDRLSMTVESPTDLSVRSGLIDARMTFPSIPHREAFQAWFATVLTRAGWTAVVQHAVERRRARDDRRDPSLSDRRVLPYPRSADP
jgi:hypothetical protein